MYIKKYCLDNVYKLKRGEVQKLQTTMLALRSLRGVAKVVWRSNKTGHEM